MAQIAAGQKLPVSGTVFLSLNDLTKPELVKTAEAFLDLGFKIVSTFGTARFLQLIGNEVERVLEMHEGRPRVGNMISSGQIQLMVITNLSDFLDQIDGRRMALAYKVPIITTVAGALACKTLEMVALQDFFNVENLQTACSSP